jgi:hypothetical protein
MTPFGGEYKRERYYGKKGCNNCKIIFKQLFHVNKLRCPICNKLELTDEYYELNFYGDGKIRDRLGWKREK